jgi:beta-phosphoglucomutase
MPDFANKLKAVLFDLDGTLIDSMELHYRCWHETLSRFQISLNKRDFFLKEGTNVYRLMSNYLGSDDEILINSLISEKDMLFKQHYKFELFPGVKELLDGLIKRNLKIGIVTASTKDRLFNTIPADFLDKFDCQVTSDDGLKGKPFPDAYLTGAKLLGVHPGSVIAVENAPLGEESAKAAGIECFVVGTTLKRSDFKPDTFYFKSIKEIAKEFQIE